MLVCYTVLLRQISSSVEMKVRFFRSPQQPEGIRPDEELVLKTGSGVNTVVSSSLTPSA